MYVTFAVSMGMPVMIVMFGRRFLLRPIGSRVIIAKARIAK